MKLISWNSQMYRIVNKKTCIKFKRISEHFNLITYIRWGKWTEFSTIDEYFSPTNIFPRRIFFPDEYFSPTNIFPRRIFFPDEYFTPTNILPRRIFYPDEYFTPTNILPRRIFYPDEYFTPTNILPRRIFFPDEYFSPTNIFPRQIFFPDKYFSPTNIFPRQIFFPIHLLYVRTNVAFCTPPRVHLYTRGPSKIALRYLISEGRARVL